MSKSNGVPDDFENLDVEDQIDVICDRFEAAYQAGETPRIESFLEYVPQALRTSLLFELFGIEIEYRRERDGSLDFSEYAGRFPRESRMLWRRFFREFESQSHSTNATFVPGTRSANGNGRHLDPTVSRPAGPDYRCVGRYVLDSIECLDCEGEVWRGFDPERNREVSILLSEPAKGAGPGERVAQLKRARKAAHLHHPGIVQVLDASEEDGRFYVVSEVVDAETCRERISKEPFGCRGAVELIAQVADALVCAHNSGVVHLNVSPDQILIDASGKVHLKGFAVDTWKASACDGGKQAALVAYRAPEQFDQKIGDVGPLTDVYALGVILYELLSGHCPFRGNVQEMKWRIVSSMPLPLRQYAPDVPEDLAAICSKAMARNPEQRYSSAAALAEDLHRYLEGKIPRASHATLLQRAGHSIRTRPWRWTLVLAALAGVAASGAAMMWDDGRVRVQISTTPSQASVTYIPLGADDGLPRPGRKVAVSGDGVIETRLPPGRYHVVVVVEGHGSHEVWRTVPDPESDDRPGPYPHLNWTLDRSALWGDDVVMLPHVDVPHDSVVDNMVLVETVDSFSVGDGLAGRTQHTRTVRDFYLDPTELTWGEYRAVMDELPPSMKSTDEHIATQLDHAAVYLTFDQAVALAERLGKRLPDEFEYEYVATVAGRHRFPWGDKISPLEAWTYGPVDDHALDRVTLGDQPPIIGLFSNVAEWTSSRLLPYPGAAEEHPDSLDSPLYVVRGGGWSVVHGNPDLTEAEVGAWGRIGLPPLSARRGLGVRFARSATPRLNAEDFPGLPEESSGD